MLIKIILQDFDGKNLDDWVIKVGHIDCLKDTYEILKQTIAPSLNLCLEKLLGNNIGVNVFEKRGVGEEIIDEDKTIQIGECDENIKFICPVSSDVREDLKFLHHLPIEFFMTGDLAFYNVLLGKEHMSGHWCIWCKLASQEWKKVGHNRGEPWTLDEMRELRASIENGNVDDIPQNRKGCTKEPLFPCVPVERYIYPPLHSQIGTGNMFLTCFFDWVDYRIEEVTEVEMQKRIQYSRTASELEALEQEWDEFTTNGAVQLADQRLTRLNYNLLRESKDEKTGAFVFSSAEKKELKQLAADCTVIIKPLEEQKKRIESSMKLKRGICRTLNADLKEFKLKRGKKGTVRKTLEKALRSHGVDRPSYHGGELTGVKIKVMFQKIDTIMEDFKNIIMEAQEKSANDNEIKYILEMFTHLGFLLDGVYSQMRTNECTPESQALLERQIRATLRLWRDMNMSMQGIKIHGLEDHVVEQIDKWKAVGYANFGEDFIEQGHQFGMKEERRTKGLTSRRLAAESHSKWEWQANDIKVINAKVELMEKTSRKRKAGVIERKLQSKEDREIKRRSSLQAVEYNQYSPVHNYRLKFHQNEEEEKQGE